MLETYLELANIDNASSEFIFRPLSFCEKWININEKEVNLSSYTRAREILLSAWELIRLDKS